MTDRLWEGTTRLTERLNANRELAAANGGEPHKQFASAGDAPDKGSSGGAITTPPLGNWRGNEN